MYPRTVFELMKNKWPRLGFELQEDTKERLVFTTNFAAQKYFDDSVFTTVIVYDNACYHVFFTFDKINPTPEVLTLVNEFNINNPFLKATIEPKNGINFLVLHYGCINGNNEYSITEDISELLNSLINTDVLKFLVPLTEITQ